jgi:hypothetical protein
MLEHLLMKGKLVSSVEWWQRDGKWTCSLICYDNVFSQIWLELGINLSFEIQPGRYCVGYTTVSSSKSGSHITLEPWKDIKPCPSESKVRKSNKCLSCYQADLVHPCLICDGTKCSAEPSVRESCQEATAYVYLASFGPNRLKVGVAHKTRIPQRWIEQGANLAKRIVVGNGIEARRSENALHRALNVLSGLKTDQKIDTLWKRQGREEVNALAKAEEEIKKRFPDFPYYHDTLHDLSDIYNLPPLDRRPIELKVKRDLQISGEVLGVKGSLLLLSIKDLPHFLNLKHLMGRKIVFRKADSMTMQTALDKF